MPLSGVKNYEFHGPIQKKAVDSAAGFSSISTNHVMTECDTIAKQQTNLFFEPRFGTPIFLANK